MNPVSLALWTLEDNCWIVFSTLICCFCFFLYVDRKNRRPEGEVREDRDEKTQLHQGHRERRPEPPDEDGAGGARPALPADTPHVPHRPPRRSDADVAARARSFYELMRARRTVRYFSDESVPEQVLVDIIRTAGTAPSGAHTEPWTFVLVQDQSTKAAIRDIVEQEEELNYSSRMSRQWVADLTPFRTRPLKPYLTDAPALVLLFRQTSSPRPDGGKRMHYYSEMSCAIAAGFLLAAVQYAGLVALTSTPLNCNARLRTLLQRPPSERLELLLPVGRPHPDATVPDLTRKSYSRLAVHV